MFIRGLSIARHRRPETAPDPVRDSHHRALPTQGIVRGGVSHRDVPGRRIRASRGGRHRAPVGFATVAVLLKATYAQEDADATLAKTRDVERKLREMRQNSAADVYAKGVRETLTYLGFPREHWLNIRTNNILERLNREIRRRTRVVNCLQKHPRLRYENMLACFRIARLAAFSQTGIRP